MLHNLNILIHVMAGILGIVVGIMAYASPKGGRQHAQWGKIFLYLMALVILTALIGTLFFVIQPFLTVVTFQSFYYSYFGYRVLQTKDRRFSRFDFMVMLLVFTIIGAFLSKLYLDNSIIVWNRSVVSYMLLYIGTIVCFDMLRYLFPRHLKMPKGFWLYDHVFKMTSAFVALVSAGVGSVLVAWEPFNQIIPAALGTQWLIFCLIYYPRALKRKRKVKQMVLS